MSPANRFQMPMPEKPFPLGQREERPEPFPRVVEVRELPCAGCGAVCRYSSSTGTYAGSPEFLKAHPDVWFAFGVDPKTDTLDLLAACSEDCVQRLLRS